jgi:hypothetical protein
VVRKGFVRLSEVLRVVRPTERPRFSRLTGPDQAAFKSKRHRDEHHKRRCHTNQPVLHSREGAVDKVVQKIIELGRQTVQFATPYYPYFSFVQRPFEMEAEYFQLLDQAVTVPSTATRAIGEACRQAEMVDPLA